MEEPKQRKRGGSKLTEEQIMDIKRLRKKGYTYRRLAELFPAHRSTIHVYLKKCGKSDES